MAKKKKKSNRLFWILTGVGTLVIVPIAFLILSSLGERSGIEFSPDDFSMREFNYCRLPLVGWTRRGIKYEQHDNPNGQTLIDDDFVRVTGRTEKRWHLVNEKGGRIFPVSKIPSDCDARFLTRYLSMTNDEGQVEIMRWTDENPESAKIFWPLIAEMARDRVYLPVPQLMEFVLSYNQPDKADFFEPDLRDRISEAWYQAGLTDQLNGKHERAIRRFDYAMETADGHELARKAKEVSKAATP